IVALNESILPGNLGWRVCFALGVVLGVVILLVRRNVPESPRWLLIHGREDEAEEIVADPERKVRQQHGDDTLPEPEGTLTIRQRQSIGLVTIARSIVS